MHPNKQLLVLGDKIFTDQNTCKSKIEKKHKTYFFEFFL
jgi:hypothetical protein